MRCRTTLLAAVIVSEQVEHGAAASWGALAPSEVLIADHCAQLQPSPARRRHAARESPGAEAPRRRLDLVLARRSSRCDIIVLRFEVPVGRAEMPTSSASRSDSSLLSPARRTTGATSGSSPGALPGGRIIHYHKTPPALASIVCSARRSADLNSQRFVTLRTERGRAPRRYITDGERRRRADLQLVVKKVPKHAGRPQIRICVDDRAANQAESLIVRLRTPECRSRRAHAVCRGRYRRVARPSAIRLSRSLGKCEVTVGSGGCQGPNFL